MALYGTDQSKWQSNTVTEGDFIICKATEGTSYVDPTCDAKYQLNKKAGKLLGVYHFARPDLGNSAESEATFFYNNIKGYLKEAVIVLDWEKSVHNVSWAKAFLDKFFALSGIRPMIYMSASVVTGYNWSTVAPYYGLWIAGYPAKYNVVNPPRPGANELPYKIGAWKFAAMWQYTSSAGTLDRNIFYGDAKAWKAYAGTQTKAEEKVIEQVAQETEQKSEKKDESVIVATPEGEPATVTPSNPEEKREEEDSTPRNPVSTDAGLSIDEYEKNLKRIEQSVDLAVNTAKGFGVSIPMSNKVYDILKVVVTIVLPLISTLYLGLANIWGFGFGEQVDQTIQLAIAAINALLGIAIVKSSADYHKGD